MNRILPYVLIAILLGAVTMVVPYVLFDSRGSTSLTDGDEIIQPLTAEPTSETEQLDSGGQDCLDGEDVENPASPTDKAPVEEPKSEISGTMLDETDNIMKSLSNFFPIVLMTIPSFLIAFCAFIYLKKWRL